VQHNDGRRVIGRRTGHAVFEIGSADAKGAEGCERGHVSYTCGLKLTFVMPALVAGIHVFPGCQKGVDGRVI
jgi:hypothetical protein